MHSLAVSGWESGVLVLHIVVVVLVLALWVTFTYFVHRFCKFTHEIKRWQISVHSHLLAVGYIEALKQSPGLCDHEETRLEESYDIWVRVEADAVEKDKWKLKRPAAPLALHIMPLDAKYPTEIINHHLNLIRAIRDEKHTEHASATMK